VSILESRIEYKLIRFCKEQGILCEKLVKASESGWPDRTLLYKGRVMFLELKRLGEKPEPLQQWILDSLVQKGFVAKYADNFEDCVNIIEDWRESVDIN
jgi:hypothetical protein